MAKKTPIDLSMGELMALDVHIWGGQTKLQREDLCVTDSEIPPEKLANLGTIRIVDPKDLAEQSALKRSAERTCLKWGTRFLGGFFIAKDKAEEVVTSLDDLKQRFDEVTNRIESQRDAMVRKWAAGNPEWENLILTAAERAIARMRIPHFRFTPIIISGADSRPEAINDAAEMLGSQLMLEVQLEAKQAYEKSFQGKESCTRKALGPLVRMREKLFALRFANTEAVDVICDIDQVIAALPKNGPIEGAAMESLVALTLRLKNGDVRKGAESPFTGIRGIEELPDVENEEPQRILPLEEPAAQRPLVTGHVVPPMPRAPQPPRRVISF